MPRRAAKLPVAPLSARSRAELRALQRATLAVVMNPLTRANRTAPRLRDGRATRRAVAAIAKPNDRLTALERLEIYNRMYWFRVLDSLHEDCPGLRAALGERRFLRLAEAFLQKHPSRYWTLRDLPQRLAQFIRAQPRWTAPHTDLCADLARFEWAQVEVYDGAAFPVFTIDDLLDANPAKLRLNLQPYLQLLELRYPVDDYLIAIRKREALLRGDASNAPTALRVRADSKVPRPRRAPCRVAVHRHEGKSTSSASSPRRSRSSPRSAPASRSSARSPPASRRRGARAAIGPRPCRAGSAPGWSWAGSAGAERAAG
ncbi:putative DNA-binding domain-containing protein [Oleiharenicola sp. Vm1]|uniref:HvfC/BufC family peptide modification chaperone n=1 Tax=Oleiharenicola sp. Vm1 TaxID=3398393 RepID=UPI0039F64577